MNLSGIISGCIYLNTSKYGLFYFGIFISLRYGNLSYKAYELMFQERSDVSR